MTEIPLEVQAARAVDEVVRGGCRSDVYPLTPGAKLGEEQHYIWNRCIVTRQAITYPDGRQRVRRTVLTPDGQYSDPGWSQLR